MAIQLLILFIVIFPFYSGIPEYIVMWPIIQKERKRNVLREKGMRDFLLTNKTVYTRTCNYSRTETNYGAQITTRNEIEIKTRTLLQKKINK